MHRILQMFEQGGRAKPMIKINTSTSDTREWGVIAA